MAFEGMDTDRVMNTSNQLKNQAEHINNVISAINGLVTDLEHNWHGKDATDFAGWWHDQHRPALQKASEAINGLGQSAYNNAQAQINASNS